MTAERLVSILNLVTMAMWLPLVLLPRARWATRVVPMVMPLLLAVVYVVLVASVLPHSEEGWHRVRSRGMRTITGGPLIPWRHEATAPLNGWRSRAMDGGAGLEDLPEALAESL